MPDSAAAGGRTALVAANWKMHKTVAETEDFLERAIGGIGSLGGVEIAICPPFTALATAVGRARRSPIRVAAQNMHQEEAGAFTGEVSAAMLVELGAWGVVLGHSERRRLFCESDAALAEKVPAALEAGLAPILCVGESEAERDAGETEAVLERQVGADLARVGARDLGRIAIAYEPVWAIGTGRTATPGQAEEAIAHIRALLAARDEGAAEAVRILYGGSVKPENAGELMARPGIDGALVGGASLDPDDFLEICAAASSASHPGAAG